MYNLIIVRCDITVYCGWRRRNLTRRPNNERNSLLIWPLVLFSSVSFLVAPPLPSRGKSFFLFLSFNFFCFFISWLTSKLTLRRFVFNYFKICISVCFCYCFLFCYFVYNSIVVLRRSLGRRSAQETTTSDSDIEFMYTDERETTGLPKRYCLASFFNHFFVFFFFFLFRLIEIIHSTI